MAVTGATVAAAATMMAAIAAIFLSFVLCFYICLCAKRARGGAPPPQGSGVLAHLRYFFCGGDGRVGGAGGDGGAALWYHDGGLDEASMASLPSREVAKGEEAIHCAVCIAEVAAGETARVLPRCGHGFHVACVDMWLKSHSTCPLCRCPAVDAPPLPPKPVQAPEADEEAPNFPTNVLFFGSQDDVSTGGAQPPAVAMPPHPPPPPPSQAPPPTAGGARGVRRLLGCGGASPPPRHQEEHDAVVRDIEMGLAGGEHSTSRQPKPAGSF